MKSGIRDYTPLLRVAIVEARPLEVLIDRRCYVRWRTDKGFQFQED